jgi:hypothetical protein
MGKETAPVDEIVIIDQQDRILHQLEEMFEKMPLSDVTFNIVGRKFAAHTHSFQRALLSTTYKKRNGHRNLLVEKLYLLRSSRYYQVKVKSK